MPISPFDNALALRQMTEGFIELNSRPGLSTPHPKLVTLGGDHSIALPTLRSLYKVHGGKPITVVHFDGSIHLFSC
jgi:agmatinase